MAQAGRLLDQRAVPVRLAQAEGEGLVVAAERLAFLPGRVERARPARRSAGRPAGPPPTRCGPAARAPPGRARPTARRWRPRPRARPGRRSPCGGWWRRSPRCRRARSARRAAGPGRRGTSPPARRRHRRWPPWPAAPRARSGRTPPPRPPPGSGRSAAAPRGRPKDWAAARIPLLSFPAQSTINTAAVTPHQLLETRKRRPQHGAADVSARPPLAPQLHLRRTRLGNPEPVLARRPSRVLVEETIYERFIERAIKRVAAITQGNPLDRTR